MKIAKPTVVADDALLIKVDIMKAKPSCKTLPTGRIKVQLVIVPDH